MRTLFAAFALLALTACGQPAPPVQTDAASPPSETAQPGVSIADAWAPASPGGARTGVGYMILESAAGDRLLSASSPRAAHVELHEMSMGGNVMKMGKVDGVDLPAGQLVAFKSGGLHMMFLDLTAPFVADETVPLTLTFEKAGAVETQLNVRAPS
jgi:copper(I)-binding protein